MKRHRQSRKGQVPKEHEAETRKIVREGRLPGGGGAEVQSQNADQPKKAQQGKIKGKVWREQ